MPVAMKLLQSRRAGCGRHHSRIRQPVVLQSRRSTYRSVMDTYRIDHEMRAGYGTFALGGFDITFPSPGNFSVLDHCVLAIKSSMQGLKTEGKVSVLPELTGSSLRNF